MLLNKDLRVKIMELAISANEGHLPSSYSIVDIIEFLYGHVLKIDKNNPNDPQRDVFILSTGHGALALYVVLNKFGFISSMELSNYGSSNSILGGHPDRVSTPFVEASTGSLGHGLPFATGIALGSKVKNANNRIFVLLGDGECQEGSVWEAANIAANQHLTNLISIVDWNDSAAQLMPIENLRGKWESFGWATKIIDGHTHVDFKSVFSARALTQNRKPLAVIAKTTKGKGVPMLEGHGSWHHKIPNNVEESLIRKALK
jgi:transketolase